MRRLADETKALRQMPAVPVAQAQAMLHSATQRLGEGSRAHLQGDRVTVSLHKVSGAKLAEWLTEVRSGARMRPLESKLTQSEPGIYSGTITLAFSGAPAPGR
jgi:general secretion pathway protein M